MIKIENQLDTKWNKWYIGKVKTAKFKDNACFLFSLTYMYSVKLGRQVSPSEVDKMFVENGVYNGALINSEKAAQVLGLQYFGVERDINKAPNWHPSIKRVDYSARPGKQYHFVVREAVGGKRVILDPCGGVQRDINYYERLVGDTSWVKDHGFEYRLFKV
jgi:hypothetical protein